MPVDVITVEGQVLLPSSDPAPGGLIHIDLSEPGSVSDGVDDHIIGGHFRTGISETGVVGFDLVPNDLITTFSGLSFYKATFYVPGTDPWRRLWILDSGSDPDPIDIGNITNYASIDGVAVPDIAKIGNVLISNPQNGDVLIYNSATGRWENGPQTGGGGPANLTGLTDTDIATLSDGDFFQYDSAAGKWKNQLLKLPPVSLSSLNDPPLAAEVGQIRYVTEPGWPDTIRVAGTDGSGNRRWKVLVEFN